jgi:hypothetical protein
MNIAADFEGLVIGAITELSRLAIIGAYGDSLNSSVSSVSTINNL